MHPGPEEIVRFAAGETSDSAIERHLDKCGRCAAAVQDLLAGLAAAREGDGEWTAERDSCLSEDRIAALAEASLALAERDACIEHLAACGRCRAAAASVAAALVSKPVAREVRRLEAPRRRILARYGMPAAVAAAVLALLVIDLPSTGVAPAHREGPVTVAPAPVAIAPAGPVSAARVLRWHPVQGADRYRVTLFDADGRVLHEAWLSDTVAPVPEDLDLAPGRPYFWTVAARTGWDRWVRSELVEFRVADGEPR